MARLVVRAYRDIESGLILRYDVRRVLARGGAAVSSSLRQRLRSGVQPDGAPLPRPEDGGQPLRRSGSLLRRIGYSVRLRPSPRVVVWAKGQRTDLGPSLRGRQAGLLAVLIYGRRTWRRRPRMDPMRITSQLEARLDQAVTAELARQLDVGQARLVTGILGRRVRRPIDSAFARRLLQGGG